MAEKRSSFAMFINTASGSTTTSYALIGDGVTELTVNYNPQTTTEQYIHQDVATTDITSYQPNAPVSAKAIKGDETFDYINGMRKKLPIGSAAYTDVILVDTYETEAAGYYPASKQPVSIQIDTYGGAATDGLSISYTINWRGTGVDGTFNPETMSFTEAATTRSQSAEPAQPFTANEDVGV